MLLETFQAKLSAQGRSEEEIDDITYQLLQRFPETFLQYETEAVPDTSDSADIPFSVAAEYVESDGSEEDPRKDTGRLHPPVFEASDEEKEQIRDFVLEKGGAAAASEEFLKRLQDILGQPVLLGVLDRNRNLGDAQAFSVFTDSELADPDGFAIDPDTKEEHSFASGRICNRASAHVNRAIMELFPKRWLAVMEKAIEQPLFRIHLGGDFTGETDLRMWVKLVGKRRDVRFFSYTRSWKDKKLVPLLNELAEQKNCRLVLVCDEATDVPRVNLVPSAIRGWVAKEDQGPPVPVEVIFRDKSYLAKMLRARSKMYRSMIEGDGDPEEHEKQGKKFTEEMAEHVRGFFVVKGQRVPVCPLEMNPGYIKKSGEQSCQNCGWCFSFLHSTFGAVEEQEIGVIDKITGAKTTEVLSGLSRFQRRSTTPPACLGCYGECGCGKCKCTRCEIHETCVCCCSCSTEEEVEEETCGCVEDCKCDPCACEECDECEMCEPCCCICKGGAPS